MKKLILVLMIVGLVSSANAADYIDTGDGLWTTAANWSDVTVPNDSDVRIGNSSSVDQTCTIGSGIIGLASRVRLGEDGNVGTLIIDGGSLSTGDGAVQLTGDDVRVGYSTSVGTHGILNLVSGSLTVAKDLEIGLHGIGTFTQTAGTTIVGDDIVLGTVATGVINLNGGTVTQTATYEGNGLLTIGAFGSVNFGGAGLGTLVLWGNQVSSIQGYINADQITSDLGGVAVDLTSNPGLTTVYAVPEPATMVLLGLGGMLLRRKK